LLAAALRAVAGVKLRDEIEVLLARLLLLLLLNELAAERGATKAETYNTCAAAMMARSTALCSMVQTSYSCSAVANERFLLFEQ
jgi:hypothetical protein